QVLEVILRLDARRAEGQDADDRYSPRAPRPGATRCSFARLGSPHRRFARHTIAPRSSSRVIGYGATGRSGKNDCDGAAVVSSSSAVAAREKERRADLEGFGTGDEEPEGIGQPIDGVEREGDRERVLDLGARDPGGQQRADVLRSHRVLARELA